jgi:arylformamidase
VIGLFEIGGRKVRVDFARGLCLAIPLQFAGPQPNHFGAERARTEPMRAGDFIGDVNQGGSCNVPIITLNPHCNGTHTESVAHILTLLNPIGPNVPGDLAPATLITVKPTPALECGETYRPPFQKDDLVITASALRTALADRDRPWLEAVVIRLWPNDPEKQWRRYGDYCCPPFFSIEAIDYLKGPCGVRHLLVDVPSVDRLHDEGLLTVHHRFWNVPEGSHEPGADQHWERTITEMIYVPEAIADGNYLLSLQVPAFEIHVAPARPVLYPVEFI